MNKNKAIEYIKRAKEQLSYDLLTIRLCEMARNNLQKALKELETESPRKGKEYQRRYYQKKRAEKKEKKIMLNPDIDKAKSLFRDPSKTVHLQWLLEHNRNKSKQYESR